MLADGYEQMLSSALTVLSQYGTTSPEISQQVLVGAFSVMIADETGCFDSKTIDDILRADTFVRAGNVLLEQNLYKNTGMVFSPGTLLLKKRLIASGVQQIPDIEKAVPAFLRYAKLTHLTGLSLKQLEKIYQQREMNLISPLFAAEQVRKACTPLHIEHLLRICAKKSLRLVAEVQNEQPAPITDKAFTAEAKGFVARRNAVQALVQELKEHTAKSKKRYQSLKQWLTTYQSEQEVDELSGSLLNFIVDLAHDKVTPAYASSTLSRYLSALNPLIEIFEYRNFSELDTDALAKGFQRLLNRTTSNVTQAILPRFIRSIRHLIPDAARLMAQLDMSADQMEADSRILGPSEGAELILKLLGSEHRWDLENGLIIALGFYCGLRRGEVLGLRL
ncbi:MAG: hypothetical protein R3204_14960, partial [Oceanospirillum sp.]|nr:hypothetical protein [Oceanospirillum sp.]